MPQPPFLIDQIQIEPGSAGSRIVKRNSATGGLTFTDAVVTGGLDLVQLAGLRNIGGVMVVGRSGAGAQWTTVQAALDAVPNNSSAASPWIVLIGPGTYNESINIVKDGIWLVGLGGVILSSLHEATPDVNPYHTITIQAANPTIPHSVVLKNLSVTNAHTNFACVRIVGAAASQVGDDAVRLVDVDLTASGKPIWASSINNVVVEGGSWSASGTSAKAQILDCASFDLIGVADATALQLDYDTSHALPATAGSAYRLVGCPGIGVGSLVSPPVSSTLTSAGSLVVSGCHGMGDLTMAGNRNLSVLGSSIGALVLGGTTAAILDGSSRGTATGATATLAEPVQRGSSAFNAQTSKAVTFTVPHPDANYVIGLELDGQPTGLGPWVTNKTATGFTIHMAAAETLTILWSAIRATGSAVNG